MNRFSKNDVIKVKWKFYTCIVCDEEFAVFAKLKKLKDGGVRTNFKKIFVVYNQVMEDGFDFEYFGKLTSDA